MNTAADTIALEQLEARRYWDELVLPSGRRLKAAARS